DGLEVRRREGDSPGSDDEVEVEDLPRGPGGSFGDEAHAVALLHEIEARMLAAEVRADLRLVDPNRSREDDLDPRVRGDRRILGMPAQQLGNVRRDELQFPVEKTGIESNDRIARRQEQLGIAAAADPLVIGEAIPVDVDRLEGELDPPADL